MTTNNPNKDVSASETTTPRTPGAGNFRALNDVAWRQKVDDDNTFLRNQVATISNALGLLLARTPQTTAEGPFNPFMQTTGASPNQPGANNQAGAHNPGAPFQASSSQQSQPGATDGGLLTLTLRLLLV